MSVARFWDETQRETECEETDELKLNIHDFDGLRPNLSTPIIGFTPLPLPSTVKKAEKTISRT
ncbi:MAG: hypothetical protein CXT64_00430 [Methanobacteriota archaeon]|jgi:hypothetical protein|nr:MAG: hypothetical protein CXT64_00430 [Euryarchaeota archaeon]